MVGGCGKRIRKRKWIVFVLEKEEWKKERNMSCEKKMSKKSDYMMKRKKILSSEEKLKMVECVGWWRLF